MNKIFLPELKSIEVNDFHLYPGDLSFRHDFIDGINLIVGGNGMGKTTFVNIIKYAIVGHYRSEFDYTRTYKEAKIEKRLANPWSYFSKRNKNSLPSGPRPSVRLVFLVGETEFNVLRCLEKIEILELTVNGQSILGTPISQQKYDRQSYEITRAKTSELKEHMEQELMATLAYKYEEEIALKAGMTFDDLIFFVNKILFFGEDHQTILWNDDPKNDVQLELFNKYFNDPQLNELREETKREAKYFDTKARHKSEDIRVLKGVISKHLEQSENSKGSDIKERIEELKTNIETIDHKIDDVQEERNEYDRQLKFLNARFNELNQESNNLESQLKKAEREFLQTKWVTLHPSYDDFEASLKVNEICPMCSQDLAKEFVEAKRQNTGKCLLCDQDLIEDINAENEAAQSELREKRKVILDAIYDHQERIYEYEEKLEKLDLEFSQLRSDKRDLSSQLRPLEYNELKEQDKDKDSETPDLDIFYNEISELELDKKKFQLKSKECRDKVLEISSKIEDEITKNVQRFSSLFSAYAGNFLGVECSLTFENLRGQARFYPVIDGLIREAEEELSESQRFFVDHSFRMSILSFFYNNPSFYIIETPDSSLDISYEQNAANVFIRFLEKPYSLIITSNLNNSEFLNYLSKTFDRISIINLLEIGRKSEIQSENSRLAEVFTKLEKNINEK